ncbi:metal-dependent hydrolase [Sinimarinibacterium sp. NLF-5-8]|uniref:metal-dependent hydrolase n=1 Tax=Sinimarinibacterium sp. NLF-5-8 TaxID=2698684 RepID=UPI00137BB34A|nr:metal-dependent hydrolase [Sinimarinibacterium sp. NLF-5-8]QHS09004.1 metal-dependent hydrolase [Sinimarinibacterium sp. NLF-5-8]
MMAPAHRVTGLCAGVLTWAVLADHPAAVLAIPAGLIGGNAPDALEWIGSSRWCTHRTITHWFWLWAALFIAGAYYLHTPFGPALIGYAAGGLTHLMFDVVNVVGIPVAHPWSRISFKWWPSGRHDARLCLLCTAIAGFAAGWRLSF